MKFRDYFADRFFSFFCCMAAGLLIFCLLWLAEVPGIFLALSEILLAAGFFLPFFRDFYQRKNYYGRLLKLLDQLQEKTLLMEIAEEPDFLDGRILAKILRQSQKYENDRIDEIWRQGREYREFMDLWVHEIKTPITSARLIAENEKNETAFKMEDELRKIESLVELVLYYARSTDVEKDFKVEKVLLQDLVRAALKAYARPMIQAGGRPQMENLDIAVCADRKSSAFVIGQIISNAVKYRGENLSLVFSALQEQNRVRLQIRDNGIGIDPADLPRVFDKGFTGENGRCFPKSTGMGLYLCRKLCEKMNIQLSIQSKKGEGTTVTLDFPGESFIREAGI